METAESFKAGGLTLTLRPLFKENVLQAKRFCEELDWVISTEDLHCYLYANPSGFLGAFDDDGKLISCVLATELDTDIGFIGMYITSKEHRGKGIGKVLFSKALNKLRGRNIFLVASPDVEHLYLEKGFRRSQVIITRICVKVKIPESTRASQDIAIQEINQRTVTHVLDYDRHISKIDRSDHLTCFIFAPSAHVLAAFDASGACVGYVCSRKVDQETFKLAPLYADSTEVAEALVGSLFFRGFVNEDSMLVMQTVSSNSSQAVQLAQKIGEMSPDMPIIGKRMHSDGDIYHDCRKVYAVCNLQSTLI